MTDVADVPLGTWDPAKRLWPFSLGKLPGVTLVALHVDGATADPGSWAQTDRTLIWTGGNLLAPQDAYVTVRLAPAEPRGTLTAARVALLTAAMAMFGGLGGAWINSVKSACPGELADATAKAQRLSTKVEVCQGAVGILNVSCGGLALGSSVDGPATRTAELITAPRTTLLAMRPGR